MPERVRILRVIARMNVGGPARIVADLMEDLDPDRYEQRLLIGRVGDDEADELDLRPRSFPVTRIDGLGRAPSVLADPQAVARVTSEIRSFRPHVVETHTAKAGVVGRLAALAGRAPAMACVPRPSAARLLLPAVTRAVVTTERLLARRTTPVSVGTHVREPAAAGSDAEQYADRSGVDIGPGPDRGCSPALGLAPDGVVASSAGSRRASRSIRAGGRARRRGACRGVVRRRG